MTHNRYTKLNAPFVWRWFGGGLLLLAILGWFTGCADPRTAPLQTPPSGYTETKVLWQDQASDGQIVSADFAVNHELAAISDPENDTPARLTVITYILPDCQILRRVQALTDSVPYLVDSLIIPNLVNVESVRHDLDSLQSARLDSVENAQRAFVIGWGGIVDFSDSAMQLVIGGQTVSCDSPLFRMRLFAFDVPDTTGRSAILSALSPSLLAYEDVILMAQLDTLRLHYDAGYLAGVVDNRYTLALWFDQDTTATYPFAVYTYYTSDLHNLAGQAIYAADIDTSTGYIARRFSIAMNSFEAADPINLFYTREVNWTTCFPGSSRPCLSVGSHTLRARLSGNHTRITATLVLVYAEGTP